MRLRVRSLALLSGLTIRGCCELWCRLQTQLGPALLWLWHRLAAVVPLRPLAWEPPYATGVALEKAKNKNKNKKNDFSILFNQLLPLGYLVISNFLFYEDLSYM